MTTHSFKKLRLPDAARSPIKATAPTVLAAATTSQDKIHWVQPKNRFTVDSEGQ